MEGECSHSHPCSLVLQPDYSTKLLRAARPSHPFCRSAACGAGTLAISQGRRRTSRRDCGRDACCSAQASHAAQRKHT
eukprot:476682-Prymnesium_polylepis.1